MSIRAILHSSFAFVRSIEANRSSAAVTLDHVIGEQIKLLKKGEKRTIVDPTGDSMGDRVSRYDRLEALEKQLIQVVETIEQTKGDPDQLLDLGVYEATQKENEQ